MTNDENITELDLRGFQCPLPVLKTRNRVRQMQEGDRLLVITDDPLAGLDIPNFCRESSHELLQQWAEENNDVCRFLIKVQSL